MASRQHDFIIKMIEMKMKTMGFHVVASDSMYFNNIKRNIPPTILNHRPDCLGFREKDQTICIGEAKYFNDFYSNHTLEQLKDYVSLINDKIYLIIGIPLNEKDKLQNILKHFEYKTDNLIILYVPKELLPKNDT